MEKFRNAIRLGQGKSIKLVEGEILTSGQSAGIRVGRVDLFVDVKFQRFEDARHAFSVSPDGFLLSDGRRELVEGLPIRVIFRDLAEQIR